MKNLIIVLLIITAPLLAQQDTAYTITKSQAIQHVTQLNAKLQAFKTTLEGSTGGVSDVQMRILCETQQDLSNETYALVYLGSVIGDALPDEYRRELNYALRDNAQNGERLKNIGKKIEPGTNLTMMKNMVLNLVSVFIPQIEGILGVLLQGSTK